MNMNDRKKAQKWSHWLCIASILILVVGGLFRLLAWLPIPYLPNILIQSTQGLNFGPITWKVSTMGVLASIPGTILHVLVFRELYHLFKVWETGEFLSHKAIAAMKGAGKFYLALLLTDWLLRPLFCVIASWELPKGQHSISIGIQSDDLSKLFVGAFLWLIAYVLNEGYQFRKDSELTI